jgi:hypothetical protein
MLKRSDILVSSKVSDIDADQRRRTEGWNIWCRTARLRLHGNRAS